MSVRIAGVTLPDHKHVGVALTRIRGIGNRASQSILSAVGVKPEERVRDLTERETSAIRETIERSYRVEGELRRLEQDNIRRLKEIGSYRGVRHMRRLPVRGQRTRTNSRTVRGNIRKTAGSGRRTAAEKT